MQANGKENPLNVQQHLRNLTLPVGQDASFEVRFQAESDAEVTWYRNEEELSDSSSVDILSPEVGHFKTFVFNSSQSRCTTDNC